MRERFKTYYSLTKPGVLYGNALTAAAGFLLASSIEGHFDFWLFVALNVGTTLVIASACVLNNYLDQDIDAKMERTKTRATVTGTVKGSYTVALAILLGVVGITLLYFYTNLLVVAIGIVGYIDYVVLYGMLSKRLSIHGTLVGSISGATPILAGYCAVTNTIDAGAVIAFAILFLWQLPEFYSISIYRREEYKAAGIPVMAVVMGNKHTKLQILCYTIAFVVATLLLTPFGYTGYIYFTIMALLGIYWIWLGFEGREATNDTQDNVWARKMFRFSLIMILVICVMLPVGPLLP